MKKSTSGRSSDKAAAMTIINMILILLGLIFVITASIKQVNDRAWYKLLIVVLVMGYSLLFNITSFYRDSSMLKDRIRKTFYAYILFDMLAFAFLALFVVNTDQLNEPFHYMALGMFVILIIPRHILHRNATTYYEKKEESKSKRGNYMVTMDISDFGDVPSDDSKVY